MTEVKKHIEKEELLKIVNEENIEFIPLTFDFLFKGIFMNNLDLLKEFILLQLNMNTLIKESKIELLNSELSKQNKKEYKKTVDLYVKINNYIYVNIEVNREYFKDIKMRNMLFSDKLYSVILETGEETSELRNKYFIQINLNAIDKLDKDYNKLKYGTDTVVMFGLETKQIYTENKLMYVKFLEYYRDLYYNKNEKLSISEMWLVMLASRNYEELYDTLGVVLNNEKRDRILKKVIDMSKDKFVLEEWESEKLAQLVESCKIANAKEEGRGLVTKEYIINMLKENISIELIKKVTNVSEDKILDIKESL